MKKTILDLLEEESRRYLLFLNKLSERDKELLHHILRFIYRKGLRKGVELERRRKSDTV